MAVATTVLDDVNFTYKVVSSTDIESATVQDVLGGSCTLYTVVIDCIGNQNEEVYLKLYDAIPDGGVVAGTTDPDMIFMGRRGVKMTYQIPGGFTFSSGLSYRCVSDKGTAGTTNPAAAVNVQFVVS
jgi:hypothetical protein|tara:strand:+ start:676 stop:1056 length:381 start_codon:yes stop_codon:yes gene_type:complete